MEDRGVPRRLRGVVTAGLATLLVVVGHVLGGGGVPDLALLVVLFPLLTAGVVGSARGRGTAATLAVLGGGQLALHLLLAVLHPHEAAAGPDPVTMVALHAAATVVVAVLLRHADRAADAVGAALRRVLALPRPGTPPADAPLPVLRVVTDAPRPRRRAPVALPARRGPPARCRPHRTSSAAPPGAPPTRRSPCPDTPARPRTPRPGPVRPSLPRDRVGPRPARSSGS